LNYVGFGLGIFFLQQRVPRLPISIAIAKICVAINSNAKVTREVFESF